MSALTSYKRIYSALRNLLSNILVNQGKKRYANLKVDIAPTCPSSIFITIRITPVASHYFCIEGNELLKRDRTQDFDSEVTLEQKQKKIKHSASPLVLLKVTEISEKFEKKVWRNTDIHI